MPALVFDPTQRFLKFSAMALRMRPIIAMWRQSMQMQCIDPLEMKGDEGTDKRPLEKLVKLVGLFAGPPIANSRC